MCVCVRACSVFSVLGGGGLIKPCSFLLHSKNLKVFFFVDFEFLWGETCKA